MFGHTTVRVPVQWRRPHWPSVGPPSPTGDCRLHRALLAPHMCAADAASEHPILSVEYIRHVLCGLASQESTFTLTYHQILADAQLLALATVHYTM